MEKELIKQIFRIVCVVDDMDKTIENWKQMVEFDTSSLKIYTTGKDVKYTYKGKETFFVYKYADFDMGGVEMRLVEPMNKDGKDPYSEALIKKDPGFHHLGVYTDDINKMKEKYDRLGIKPVYTEDTGVASYEIYDFAEVSGLLIAPFGEMTGPCAR